VILGFAIAVGAAAVGCGPKDKFCPDAGDGVCRPPPDAAPVDTGVDAPVDQCAIMVLGDGAVVCTTP
jgi:hypothetical protein